MSDVFTKAKRSEVMSRIRSHGNKDTELVLAKLLRRNKITGWRRKFSRNQARDQLVTRALRRAGWRVLRIWEHDLHRATKKPQNEARLLRRIQRVLIRGNSPAATGASTAGEIRVKDF